MSNEAKLQKEAMHVLKLTSRTFYIPIKLLNPTLRKTVGSAYLCMRAIDEIEDHEDLEAETKQHLLRSTSKLLQTDFDDVAYQQLLKPYESLLPEVTLRLVIGFPYARKVLLTRLKSRQVLWPMVWPVG